MLDSHTEAIKDLLFAIDKHEYDGEHDSEDWWLSDGYLNGLEAALDIVKKAQFKPLVGGIMTKLIETKGVTVKCNRIACACTGECKG